jgi:tagatose 1,6-diphosphate aldolase
LPGEKNQTNQYIEMANKKSELVLESVAEFAKPEYGVDVFKLESPVPARDCDGSAQVQALFDEMGRLCSRPWVLLSAGAGMREFKAVLAHAYKAGASGYLAGRTIWAEAFKAFPDWAEIERGLAGPAVDYMRDINQLTDQNAKPWWTNWGGAVLMDNTEAFRHAYASPEG